jgi:hypothetical protein
MPDMSRRIAVAMLLAAISAGADAAPNIPSSELPGREAAALSGIADRPVHAADPERCSLVAMGMRSAESQNPQAWPQQRQAVLRPARAEQTARRERVQAPPEFAPRFCETRRFSSKPLSNNNISPALFRLLQPAAPASATKRSVPD